MQPKDYFYFVILWICTSFAFAAADVTDLAKLLNSIKTMQADFTQTVFDNHGKAIQTSHGKMALERPGKFRWEVTKPMPQLIIANDSRLWIYDPDLEQVTIRSLKHAAGETPALLLSHVNTVLDKDFIVHQTRKKPVDWQWFTLKERKDEGAFTSVQLAFANGQIQEMRLQDQLGHTTQIQFKNAKVNTSLPSAFFVFKPKAGVDVIDETRKR